MANGNLNAARTEDGIGGNKSGFTIAFTLVHAATNTAFVNGDIDWSAVNVTMQLAGRQSSANMKDLFALFGYEKAMFVASRDWLSLSTVNVAAAVGVTEVRTLSFKFEFSNVNNLRDQAFELTFSPVGGFGANVSASGSNVDLQFIEGEGVGVGYTVFKKYPATSGQQSMNITLPDNCHRCVVFNHSESSMLTTDRIVNSLSLSQGPETMNDFVYERLIAMRNDFFEDAAACALRYQNYSLIDFGMDVDNGRLGINFNSGNITTDTTGVMIERTEVSENAIVHAMQRKTAHENRAANHPVRRGAAVKFNQLRK